MSTTSIKSSTLKELQRQLNQELGAAHAYLGLAVWCEMENLKGFARYFSKQAQEERAHAQKFSQHLLDRGVLPALGALPDPKTNFRALIDIAKQAMAMEQANTAGINACYEAALHDKDYASQPLLLELIKEQVEEEDWASEMVERVESAGCAGGVMDLDRHIERYLTEEAADLGKAG